MSQTTPPQDIFYKTVGTYNIFIITKGFAGYHVFCTLVGKDNSIALKRDNEDQQVNPQQRENGLPLKLDEVSRLDVARMIGGTLARRTKEPIPLEYIISIYTPYINLILKDFKLYQNYPNPFNPVTTIGFDLAKPSTVKLIVYDMVGNEVEVLINNMSFSAGNYEFAFDASGLASGVYIYKLISDNFTDSRKMTVIK